MFTKNSIKIIDWEYAKTNDLFFDLASLCCEFNLSKKEEEVLLKTYFKKITLLQKKKLNSYKIIYKKDSSVLSVLDLSVTKTPEAMGVFERFFGKDVTTRNWNTIKRIEKKLDIGTEN